MLIWLICGIVAGFVLQIAFGSSWLTSGRSLMNEFALTIPSLQVGHLWTLLTHSFLHDTHYLPHLFANLLGLYFLGRELLPVLGTKRFVGLYSGAILLGGLAWAAVHWKTGGAHYGATAGVDALLIVFACFYPNQRLDFLLFFVFPVSLKPKHLAFALVGFDLIGLLVYEIPQTPIPVDFAIAHSAHLGGILAGWIYYRYLHELHWPRAADRAEAEPPAWAKSGTKVASSTPYHVNLGNRTDLRAEVDRILDKINSDGFNALTADEKRLLDEAKDQLSRH